MPMLKIGTSYYKQMPRPIYLIQGNAIRNGEYAPIQGKPHGKVAVAADQSRDGESTFVTLNGWREKAEQVADVKKMDSVLAIGVLKSKTLGGITYYDMDVDFLGISGMRLDQFAETDPPDDGSWEDIQQTRNLWQRMQEEEQERGWQV